MQKKPGHSKPEEAEITVLLRTLRIEVTQEANFEERFMYDFRERLAREAVCRPARALLWEHLLHMLTNVGKRRLLWGGASVTAAVCVVVMALQPGAGEGSSLAAKADVRYSATPTFAPPVMANNTASAEDVARIIVNRRAARKSYAEQPVFPSLSEDVASSLGMVEEQEPASSSYYILPDIGSGFLKSGVELPEVPLPFVL